VVAKASDKRAWIGLAVGRIPKGCVPPPGTPRGGVDLATPKAARSAPGRDGVAGIATASQFRVSSDQAEDVRLAGSLSQPSREIGGC